MSSVTVSSIWVWTFLGSALASFCSSATRASNLVCASLASFWQLVDAGVDQRDGLVLQGLRVALDLADAGLHVGEALGGGLLGLGGVATSELVGDLGGAGNGVQGLHGLGLELVDVELGLSHVNLLAVVVSSPMVSSTRCGLEYFDG